MVCIYKLIIIEISCKHKNPIDNLSKGEFISLYDIEPNPVTKIIHPPIHR